MDLNQLKIYQKWVKMCKKQGLSYAKCGEFEFTCQEKPQKVSKKPSKNADEGVEGLVHDESAKMPNDSEMLFYATEYFDQMQANKKPQKARNEI